jgi:hypothetical protein
MGQSLDIQLDTGSPGKSLWIAKYVEMSSATVQRENGTFIEAPESHKHYHIMVLCQSAIAA